MPPKWKTEKVPSHKFEFIHIPDFHNDSAWTRFRYALVWLLLFKAILVLCGDIWTCTILIISDDWTSSIKPTIDISIARWIYTACILLSFLLLAADFRKANKVIKSQDISYAVSNKIVSGFYCLHKYDYFCFIQKIHNSSKIHDKLCFFVFFQLKGWKHVVVQAPRQIINIMTLIAFLRALGFDLNNLDNITQILPMLKTADIFTFCVMVFTSVMFVFSACATLVAVILWIPLVTKIQGNLKEYVCHKMDKRIDNIIKKTTKDRAKKLQQLEELERRAEQQERRDGGDPAPSVVAYSFGSLKKTPRLQSKRPKPTLPDIDVILANAAVDMRLPDRTRSITRTSTLPSGYNQYYQYQPQLYQDHMPHHSRTLHHHHYRHDHEDRHVHQQSHSVYLYHNGNFYSSAFPTTSQRSLGNSTSTSMTPRNKFDNVSMPSELEPIERYHYHDTNPHTSFRRANTADSENWIPHHGFTFDCGTLESPATLEQHSAEFRPDSGVLPNLNDPYYARMTTRATELQNDGGSSGSRTIDVSGDKTGYDSDNTFGDRTGDVSDNTSGDSESDCGRLGIVQRHLQIGGSSHGTVYQPDKTELEHYDSLFKGIAETHLKVKASRSMSALTRSSRASASTTTEQPFGTMPRQPQLPLPPLPLLQDNDSSNMTTTLKNSSEIHCPESDIYRQHTGRSISVRMSPQPILLNQNGLASTSSFMSSSSTGQNASRGGPSNNWSGYPPSVGSSSSNQLYNRPLFHPGQELSHRSASPALSHISLTRVSTEHLRTHSIKSSSSVSARHGPRISDSLTANNSSSALHGYGKQELVDIALAPPLVKPLPPLPVPVTESSSNMLESPTEPLNIEDVIDDIASTLGDSFTIPPPPPHYPPPPPPLQPMPPVIVSSSSSCNASREHDSESDAPTEDAKGLQNVNGHDNNSQQRFDCLQQYDESVYKVEIID
ncbi:hypothetical protein BGZ94_001773 [Podila epigama]|nr:hypothetical protein BGZ94_001773 [Podila epigama]